MGQMQMWSQGVCLLLGILLFLLVAAILTIVFWTGLRIWFARLLMRRNDDRLHEMRHRSDGLPFPPLGEGMCDRCQGAFDAVYHLPSGMRLCRGCYAETEDV